MIFADYNESYIRYLDNTLRPSEDPGFLTMHQFGPWDTDSASDTRDVGKILYAVALRAGKT